MSVCEIPSCTQTFKLKETTFDVDLVEAVSKIQEIQAECKDKTNFEHLDLFAAWLKETSKVTLTRGQADWMWDKINAEYVRGKEERRASLGLPVITQVSTSQNSQPANS